MDEQTHLPVDFRQQLEQLLLGMGGKGGESARVDEGADVGVHEDRAGGLEVHLHSPASLHGPWKGCGGNSSVRGSLMREIPKQAISQCLVTRLWEFLT